MNEICVSRKGRIEIPAKMRKKYGLLPGSKAQLLEKDNELIVQPFVKDIISRACGMLKSATSVTQELLEERAKERKREEEMAFGPRTRGFLIGKLLASATPLQQGGLEYASG